MKILCRVAQCLVLVWGLGQPLAADATVVTIASGLAGPQALARDAAGNLYFSEANLTIKRLLASSGYSTSDTLVTNANVGGIALDASLNVFFSEFESSSAKRALASGGYATVNTLASGLASPQGVAVDAGGNMFVADAYFGRVVEILAAGGYTTVNELAAGSFVSPWGLALDSNGNLFVTDSGEIKKLSASSGYATATTVRGGLGSLMGLALSAAGDIYFTEYSGSVKLLRAADGFASVTTLASGLNHPNGIAVDGAGNVFFADSGNGAIKQILAGTPVTLQGFVVD